MLKINKKLIVLLLIYLISSSFIYLQANKKIDSKLQPFFEDTNVKYRVEIALALSPNTYGYPVARIFHNKVLSFADNFVISIYRSLDPVYLFTLSKNSSSLFDDQGKMQMLYPIELPLFIISLFYLIKNWEKEKGKYKFILFSFAFSLIICGLFLPPLNPIKNFPLILTIRATLLIGIFEFLSKTKWLKKYS